MKKFILSIIICLAGIQFASAQKVVGYIYDESNGNQPLPGVTVYYTDKSGQHGEISNSKGYYEINVPEGGILLTYSYVGYEPNNSTLVIAADNTYTNNVYLRTSSNELDAVVVSAGRFDQKLSDITVSINVVKVDDIVKQNPSDLRAALNNISGVDIIDKQPSIRGGSGWTYGVGSRTAIMVDGISILSPQGGEIDWNSVPMENIEQVEVIKGASSVLYGSSALNGLINIRTSRPGIEPKTTVNAYMGIYGNPSDEDYIWWDRTMWKDGKYDGGAMGRSHIFSGVRNPMYNGLNASHTRRIGDFDVNGYMNLFTDEGYKEGAFSKRTRVGGSVTYHHPRVSGLSFGTHANFLASKSGDAFLWRSDREALRQSPIANMVREFNEITLTPFLNFYNPNDKTSHKVRGKIYFESSKSVSRESNITLPEILDNMGADYGKIVNDFGTSGADIISDAIPVIAGGDVDEIVDLLRRVKNEYFPLADAGDYMDLVSLAMSRYMPAEDGKSRPDRTSQYYVDYQFGKTFNSGGQITTGATYEHVYSSSEITDTHRSDNIAVYAQYDDEFWDKLNVSLGARMEYYRVDDHYREAETKIFGKNVPFKPVFRAGLNYQFGQASFLRASIGQGYRYPSITEKFVRKDIGGVGAFPNQELQAERGYNIELGIRQGYMFGPVKGYLDIAGFYTRYRNMIEFNIGLFNTAAPYPKIENLSEVVDIIQQGGMPGIGACFSNVEKAEIYGLDVSIMGMVDINHRLNLTYNLGYVYTEPRDMNYRETNRQEDSYDDPLQMKSKSNNSKYLKYRRKHSFKAAIDLNWKRLNIGTNLHWRSKLLAADYVMVDERSKLRPDMMDLVRSVMFGDLHGYWKQKNTDYFVMDVRAGVTVTNSVKFQFAINNLLNKEYSTRPMDLGAQRTFVFQTALTF